MKQRLLIIAAFLVSFSWYLPRAAVSVQAGDSAELTTCAYLLSVPHAPGSTVFVLCCKLFYCLPFGEIAARAGLLSVLCSALMIAFCTRITLSLIGPRSGLPSALITGSMLMLAPHFWFQALRSEVYPLANLLTMLVIMISLQKIQTLRMVMLSGLLAGLAVAVHPFMALPGLGALLFSMVRLQRAGRFPHSLLPLLLVVEGLSVLLFIPLRAHSPALFDRDLDTAATFFAFITGKAYSANMGGNLSQNLQNLLGWLALNLPLTGFVLAATGLYLSVKKWEPRHVPIFICAGLGLVPYLWYHIPDLHEYLFPLLLSMTLFAGISSARLLSSLQARRYPLALVIPIYAGVMLAPVLPYLVVDHDFNSTPESFLDRSHDFKAWRMTEAILQHVREADVICADWADGTPIFYLNSVSKLPEWKAPLFLDKTENLMKSLPAARVSDEMLQRVRAQTRVAAIGRIIPFVAGVRTTASIFPYYQDVSVIGWRQPEKSNQITERWRTVPALLKPDTLFEIEIEMRSAARAGVRAIEFAVIDSYDKVLVKQTFSPVYIEANPFNYERFLLYLPPTVSRNFKLRLNLLPIGSESTPSRQITLGQLAILTD